MKENNPQNSLLPCESCEGKLFSTVCDRKDGSVIVRCGQCGLEFVNPLPSEESQKKTYLRDMKGDNEKDPYFKEYIEERTERGKSFDKVYRTRLELIESFHGKKGILLDLGCGAGFFLQYAKNRGWNGHGLDILPEYINYGKNTLHLENLHCGPLESATYEKESFDVVTLWDLIEHLQHPLTYLRGIQKLLRPGGLMVIWTPNNKNAVYLKDQWTGYWPRQHLYFFSRDTLGHLLGKAGFKILDCKTTKTKKGLLLSQDSLDFKKILKPDRWLARSLFAARRDLKNFLNPLTYLSPLLDRAGYGFNLLVIASRQ
ncbi:MAG: class I SAM-dependent methyltransferase [Nitrospinota bacterium]|nr:class I SAM-dependent methyltransferase [Nitrospinota bacterium]